MRRLRPLLRAVPRELRALLVASLALGVAWTIVTPAWQSPDENSHFGYVQYFAQTGSLPGNPKRAVFSTEQSQAATASNSDQAAAQIATKMSWDAGAFQTWRAAERVLPDAKKSDGGGPNPASSNPPLYYLFETPAYLVGSGGDVFTRLELMRLASVPWLLVTVIAAWLLAGELFGPQRLLQVGVAGAVGLAPMVQFISATVTPDAMLFAVWGLMMWLGVRLAKRPPTARDVALFFGMVGAACVVKATSYALIPAALAVLGVSLWRAGIRPRAPRAALTPVGSAGVAMAGTLGVWLVVSRLSHRAAAAQVGVVTGGAKLDVKEFVDYVWQFYLPRIGPMTEYPRLKSIVPNIGIYDIVIKGTWGEFGWLEARFSDPLYLVLAAFSAIVLVLAVAGLWRDRARVDWGIAAFLALVVVGLFVGLHVSEYRQLEAGAPNFFQGRYLLPLAPLAAAALVRAVLWLPARGRALAIGGALGGLVALDLFSIALTLERFYA